MGFPLKEITLGFLPASRGSFSAELAAKVRGETLDALKTTGVRVVVPSEQQTRAGCVQSLQEAETCAELFRQQRVQGILVGAGNFGEEQAVAWTVRKAGLNVPILIFGCQEEETLTRKTVRRDSFCGLLSIGDVLRQIGAKYSVGQRPICFPSDASFAADLDWFLRVCRVVDGVRNARYAQIGARPDAFWTCRYSEKQLERLGPTAVVLDLSEALGAAKAMADDDPEVQKLVAATGRYADTSAVTPEGVLRSAKLELFLRRFKEQNQIDAFSVQCWTSMQSNYGVCSCAAMSRLGDEGTPAACESDILGTLSMHAALLASGLPAGLADWNNLHNEDDELANIWHCGVFPASFAKTKPRLAAHEIIVSCGGAPYEQAQGVVEFVAKPSPLTLFRVTQDPEAGWHAVLAQGHFEDNPAVTFGGYGWCRIPDLQQLYRDVLLRYFPHHVALTQTHVANVLWEAFGNYLDMKTYHANQGVPGLYTPRLPF